MFAPGKTNIHFKPDLIMKTRQILEAVLAAVILCSCTEKSIETLRAPQEIILTLDGSGLELGVDTKVSAISAVPSALFWSATTGTLKSETSKYDCGNEASPVTSGKLSTGKFQTSSPTSYNWYVSNSKMSFASGGSTISVSNNTDYIAGVATSNSSSVNISMGHVFARTGTLNCQTQSGYDISNVSWKIQSKSGGTGGTEGTYNIATGTWTTTKTALAQQAFSSSSDLYLIPGSYTVTVTYTLSKGDYTDTFTKSGDVTLVQGKMNNISCTAIGGSASSISLSVSLAGWSDNDIALTLN